MRSGLIRGFNPCFGGSYIVTTILGAVGFYNFPFQSLFWWILYCDRDGQKDDTEKGPVSILVLVDLILWLGLTLIAVSAILGFNPCFGGSYIVTYTSHHASGSVSRFNPCFGGSYIVTIGITTVISFTAKFQSLFWWILYCDTSPYLLTPPPDKVSILVLVDLILWQR